MIFYLLPQLINYLASIVILFIHIIPKCFKLCLSILISKVQFFNLLTQVINCFLFILNPALQHEYLFFIFVLIGLFFCQNLRYFFLQPTYGLVVFKLSCVAFVHSGWVFWIEFLMVPLRNFKLIDYLHHVSSRIFAQIAENVQYLSILLYSSFF